MAKILLVEDDISMGFLLVDFLESNGFDVKLYKDGKKGLDAFKKGKYDFCILDVMLPGMDGFTIAENIRQEDKKVPIIFLTARAMKQDKIKGFELGVDDYVTKPFDEDELLCRIQAILNRLEMQTEQQEQQIKEFTIGHFYFDSANQHLQGPDFSKRLTQKECDVLRMLCMSKNEIVKREDLLISIWGENDYFHGRSLDVFIAKLRKYLKDDETVSIENVPKVGFVLND
ncbi:MULTISPECIES: response regulator transcription factor [unclassified Carboxylicivirga]|uniref:response regulator transcription factor n=1 Tax=Carboxylicivirga TaxID=1628153 RepID=UPI003D33C95F